MSLAEKLQTIAENEQRVFDAGKAVGKQAEYDTFWTIYQTSGKRSDYRYAFSNHGWNNITYNPKYPVVPVSAEGMYFLSSLDEIANVDTSKLTSAPKMFYYAKAKALGEMNLSKCTNLEYWCSDAKSLVSIDKIISSEITAWHNTSFDRCTALTHVIFEGTIGKSISFSDSPLLTTGAEGETTNSVQSIIDALMTITDGVARTITVHQTVRNKLTPAQENEIKIKKWTMVPATKT